MKTQRLPVIDGDCGNGDIYGYATTRVGAMRTANRFYADPAIDAYHKEGEIVLRDGTVINGAWIATTFRVEN